MWHGQGRFMQEATTSYQDLYNNTASRLIILLNFKSQVKEQLSPTAAAARTASYPTVRDG